MVVVLKVLVVGVMISLKGICFQYFTGYMIRKIYSSKVEGNFNNFVVIYKHYLYSKNQRQNIKKRT